MERVVSKQNQKPDHKPAGLWYGIDSGWVEWCLSEEMDWIHDYWYELEVDTAGLCVLSTVGEIDDFTTRFGVQSYPGQLPNRHFYHIDWPAVSGKYDGVEISPYQWDCRFSYSWYYGWDCASGCIWSSRAVRSFKRVEKEKSCRIS